MALSSEKDPAKTKDKDKSARRSTRVTLAIPIVLSGKDISGNDFREITRTTIVNKHGAKLRTVQQLALGSEVTVENRPLALAGKAAVVWVGKRTSPQEPVEIGVQLLKPQNIWGIVFPPEDWNMSAPAELEGQASGETAAPPALTAAGTPPRAAIPNSASVPGTGKTEIPIPKAGTLTPPSTMPTPVSRKEVTGQFPAVLPAAPQVASGPSQEQIDAMSEATLARLTKVLDETVEKHFKTYAEKIGRFTNHFGVRVQGSFQDAASRMEDQMVGSLQQKLGTLADRVQASRMALEALLAKFESLQKHSATLVEDTENRISEVSQQTLESAIQELTANFRKAKGASAAFEAEYQARLAALSSKTVEEALKKAEAHLGSLMEDRVSKSSAGLGDEREQMIEGFKEQLNQLVLEATTTLDSRFESLAWETADSTRKEMDSSLQESAGQVVRLTTQTLQEEAKLLTEEALVPLDKAVQSAREHFLEESARARQSYEEDAQKAAEAFSQNIADRMESALGQWRSASEQETSNFKAAQFEFEKSVQARLEDYQKQLADRSTAALDGFQTGLRNLAWDLQEGASRLFSQGLQNIADELTKTSTEKVRQRIQDDASDAAERFGIESNRRLAALADEIMAGSVQQFRTQLAGQAEAEVEPAVRAALDKFHDQVGNLAQEAAHSFQHDAQHELQTVSSAILGATSEALRKEVQQMAVELQNDLTASHTVFADDARKQLIAMGQSALETLTRDASGSLEEFRVRLLKTAEESREESLRALEARFQEELEKQRATLASFLEQQAEQCREQAALQIKALSEQAVIKSTDELDRQLGRSTRTIAELGDKARVGLEAHVQKTEVEAKNSVWEFQRQIDESGSAALDKFRKETSTLVDEVVFRLQHSVRSFQSETSEEVRAELQKASDNLLEVSAAQMRKQTEQTLELITVRLKEKEEEVVNDAAEVFRTRIADIFTILQTGTKKAPEFSAPERVKKQS